MSENGTQCNTPVGRIVWGHPQKSQQKKNQETGAIVLNDQGQPVEQWVFGVAFTKQEFQEKIWPFMAQEAQSGFPNGFPQKFSWKYKDGDGMDPKNQPYSNREGYAGCFVLTVSTELQAPPCYKFENGTYRQLGPDEIKTGDYVALALNLKVNIPKNSMHTPGLYVNPVAVEFVGYGQAIMNTPDPQTLFGGVQHQLPPGASTTPIAVQSGVGMPGTGQPQQPGMQQAPQYQQPMQPAPGQMPAQQPAPQYQQPQAPAQQPQQPGMMPPPAHDFIPQAATGQQPAPQYQQPQAPQPQAGQPQMPQQQPGQQQPMQPGQIPGMMPPR